MPSALITGLSRRAGIAAATASRLRRAGWSVFTTGWRAYDAQLPHGQDAEQPIDLEIVYAASKGALEWIALSAAVELGPRGITVNAVNPGPNSTPPTAATAPPADCRYASRTGAPYRRIDGSRVTMVKPCR